MLHRLKPKSEFSRNVLTLMTGSSIAQAIPIAISPILTRIYTPEDFGLFALYMSIATIFSVIATGRYELAIMLPKKDEDAINLVILSLVLSFIISSIIFLIIFFFNSQIVKLLGNSEISFWLYFIPLSVLLTGIYQSLNYWFTRKRSYKKLASNKILQSITTGTTNIGMGISGLGVSGLMWGTITGRGVAILVLFYSLLKEKNHILNLKYISILKIIIFLKKFRIFPLVNMPNAFLNIFSSNVPILILGYYFEKHILGFYMLANKMIALPTSIVSSSFSQVFFQKMSVYRNSYNERKNFFKKSMFQLLFISLFPAMILFSFAPNIFNLFFGDGWEVAGYYVQILVPMLYLRFTGAILSSVVIIFNQQKKAFLIEIISTLCRLVVLVIGGIIGDVIFTLVLYSIVSSIITIYRLYWYSQIVTRS